MLNLTPRRAYAYGIRTLAIAGPLALLMLGAWGLRWQVLGTRPQLALMLYMLFLLVAVGGLCVAVLASCHLAIHRAFGIGLQAGKAAGQGDGSRAPTISLRVVE